MAFLDNPLNNHVGIVLTIFYLQWQGQAVTAEAASARPGREQTQRAQGGQVSCTGY